MHVGEPRGQHPEAQVINPTSSPARSKNSSSQDKNGVFVQGLASLQGTVRTNQAKTPWEVKVESQGSGPGDRHPYDGHPYDGHSQTHSGSEALSQDQGGNAAVTETQDFISPSQ